MLLLVVVVERASSIRRGRRTYESKSKLEQCYSAGASRKDKELVYYLL